MEIPNSGNQIVQMNNIFVDIRYSIVRMNLCNKFINATLNGLPKIRD